MDWQYLLTQAHRHGVVQLLYFNLTRAPNVGAPAGTIASLKSRFRTTATHNIYLLGQLLVILEEFARIDIPVIPFKGPVSSSHGLRRCLAA